MISSNENNILRISYYDLWNKMSSHVSKNVQVDSGVKLGKNDTIKDNAKVAKSTIKGTYKRRYN